MVWKCAQRVINIRPGLDCRLASYELLNLWREVRPFNHAVCIAKFRLHRRLVPVIERAKAIVQRSANP